MNPLLAAFVLTAAKEVAILLMATTIIMAVLLGVILHFTVGL